MEFSQRQDYVLQPDLNSSDIEKVCLSEGPFLFFGYLCFPIEQREARNENNGQVCSVEQPPGGSYFQVMCFSPHPNCLFALRI